MVNIYCCLANFHESMESEGERFHSEFKLVMSRCIDQLLCVKFTSA